jgi:spermidine synthase
MMALLPALKTDEASGTTIDTASARYIVKQGPYRDGREVTMLIAGPKGVQSAVYTDGSRELVFWYQQQMAEVVGKMFAEQDEFRALILGGGAFTMPDYLARKYPNAQVDVVEIDPTLYEIAKEHFGMEDLPNMKVYAEDARSFVRRAGAFGADSPSVGLLGAGEKYDFILVDVSYDIAMPWQFVTREFGDAVAELLDDDGVMAVNMLASEVGGCGKMYDAVYGIYARNLPNRYMVRYESGAEVVTNTELFFSRTARPELGLTALDKKIGTTYTDSFAPIEHLLLSCHR